MKTMKFLAVVLLAVVAAMAKAQTYSDHINLGVGAYYERQLDGTFAYEHETKYHNSWEYFFNYSIKYDKDEEAGHYTKKSFWHSYNAWGLGIACKPCINRGRNHHGNLRLGASLGGAKEYEGESKFHGDLHLGYEHSYQLRQGWHLYWQAKTDMSINGKDLLRVGVALGIKLPLGRR